MSSSILPAVVSIPQLNAATTLNTSALFIAVQTTAGVIETFRTPLSQIQETISSALFPSLTTTIVTTPVTLSSTVSDVLFNVAGVATATLPSPVLWKALNPFALLLLKDISGAAGVNTITINAAGTSLIDGLTNLTINGNYGFYNLKANNSNWIVV